MPPRLSQPANARQSPRPAETPGITSRDLTRLSFRIPQPLPPGRCPGLTNADEIAAADVYFHNAAWTVRGLRDFAAMLRLTSSSPRQADAMAQQAESLCRVLLETIDWCWAGPSPWPGAAANQPPCPDEGITASRGAGYANYRYWPELMGSGVLPAKRMRQLLRARLTSGGQFAGASRIRFHGEGRDVIDNWPIVGWFRHLASMGLGDELQIGLLGHILYHQAQDHLAAYESVTMPPGRRFSDYCLPCQLVVARSIQSLAPARSHLHTTPSEDKRGQGRS